MSRHDTQREHGTISNRIMIAGAALFAVAPMLVQAQEVRLEEVMVTAQKRSERLQDVPISDSAISAADAFVRGVKDITSLQTAVPGLVINHTANEGNIFIRGVGTNLFGPASEQTVAVYVDGVYLPSPESNMFEFNNIERIEVLKGPQGTLFGRNTTGGVVQVITREPTHELAADVSVGYGNFDTITAQAYVGGGVTDSLSADIAVMYSDQGEGWGHNFTTDLENGIKADDNFAVRSKLHWDIGENTVVKLLLDYSESYVKYDYQLLPGIVSPINPTQEWPGEYNALGGLNDFESVRQEGASLQVEHQAGSIRIVNILAYRDTDVGYLLDQDDTPVVAADLGLPSRAHNWSEELQVYGPDDARVKWMVGAFYFDAIAGYNPLDINDGVIIIDDDQETTSVAGFGQLTTQIFEDTNLTLGARYTSEDQDYTNDTTFLGTALPRVTDSQSFSETTWRVAVDHRFSEDVMGYISADRGFKSGGYNLIVVGGTDSFLPETLDAYQIGLKSEWLDNRLRVNAAAFWYDYKDIQIEVPVTGGTTTDNGPAARIKGLEVEVTARPVESLNLTAGLTYLDSEYTDFENAVAIGPEGQPGTVDATGNQLVSAPELSGNFSVSWNIDLASGSLVPALNLNFNDGYFFYADNRLTQPSYWLANASLTWFSEDDRFSVQAWGRNLNDETYYEGRSEQGGLGDAQRQAAPRTYGVTFRYKL